MMSMIEMGTRAAAALTVAAVLATATASAHAGPHTKSAQAALLKPASVVTISHKRRHVTHHTVVTRSGRDVMVDAPTTTVETRGRRVAVDAPFAHVRRSAAGVHVRAPFVDLWLPRR